MALRVLSGIIGIAIAAFVIQMGDLIFFGATILLALLMWHEYSVLYRFNNEKINFFFGMLTLILFLYFAYENNLTVILIILIINMILISLSVLLKRSINKIIESLFYIAGIFYIGFPLIHLILIRSSLISIPSPYEIYSDIIINLTLLLNKFGLINLKITPADKFLINIDTGCAMIWLLFTCTWASDIFAYFIGTKFGSHKLAPSISPNKTIEGFIGAIFGTILTAIFVGSIIFGLSIGKMLLLGFILAITATLGDLFESIIKRSAGVKDSGVFLPGHGGVLDRFDSLLFTAPTFYCFINLTGIA